MGYGKFLFGFSISLRKDGKQLYSKLPIIEVLQVMGF